MTCAICVSDRGPFTKEPLGRDDALVSVCAACATEPARAYDSERNYEPTGGLLSTVEITSAMRRVMGDEAYEAESRREETLQRTPAVAVTREELDLAQVSYETKRTVLLGRDRTWLK